MVPSPLQGEFGRQSRPQRRPAGGESKAGRRAHNHGGPWVGRWRADAEPHCGCLRQAGTPSPRRAGASPAGRSRGWGRSRRCRTSLRVLAAGENPLATACGRGPLPLSGGALTRLQKITASLREYSLQRRMQTRRPQGGESEIGRQCIRVGQSRLRLTALRDKAIIRAGKSSGPNGGCL